MSEYTFTESEQIITEEIDCKILKENNVIRKEEFAIWKIKLKNVIHNLEICGICLEQFKNLWNINDELMIADNGTNIMCSTTLKDVLESLCNCDAANICASVYLCNNCTQSTIKSYLFIKNVLKSAKIITRCLEMLNLNTKNTLMLENIGDYEKTMICISLDDVLNGVERNLEYENALRCHNCSRFIAKSEMEDHIANCRVKASQENIRKINKNGKISENKNLEIATTGNTLNAATSKWYCTICNNNYYSITSFTNHIENDHNITSKENWYHCQLCLKTYFSEKMFQDHKCKYRCSECPEIICKHAEYLLSYRNQKEQGIKVAKCLKCSFYTLRKGGLIAHVNLDHLQTFIHVCDICGDNFQSKPALSQHRLKCHCEVFHCSDCDQDFGSQNKLDKHKSVCATTERPFNCEHCTASFTTEDLREIHKLKHFNKHSCQSCTATFWSQGDLNEHQRKEHKAKIYCTMCTEDFATNSEYLEHAKTHPQGTKHVCRLCGQTFNSKINHRRHTTWHMMSQEKRICTYCSKLVSSRYFHLHLKTHTARLKNPKRFIKRDFKCNMCNKYFVSEAVMQRHKETHKDHSQCPICNRYVKTNLYQSHIESHDPKKKTIQCDLCDYSTIYPACMDAHTNRMHLKCRPYKCTDCYKDFFSKNSLHEHAKSHVDAQVRNKVKQCNICGNYLANNQCMKTHMRRHTGEKPYQCDICNDRFLSASRRKQHYLKKHTTPAQYCPVCNSVFHSMREVRMHYKKTHVNDGEPLEEHMYLFEDKRRKV